MPHVSSKRLKKQVFRDIEEQLFKTLARADRAVLRELLTSTERTMLAKRLAAVFMLAEDFSYYRISRTLTLSVSTVRRLDEQLKQSRFSSLHQLVLKKKERDEFRALLGKILRGGLPKVGRGRWQNVNQILAAMP